MKEGLRGSKATIGRLRRGDHVLAWCDGPGASDRVMGEFLRSGSARNDLMAVVAPAAEHPQIRDVFGRAGLDFAGLKAQGRVVLWDAESWYPIEERDAMRISMFLDILESLAEAWDRRGVSFLGRIAASLLERGDARHALLVEETLHDRRSGLRSLCPINADVMTKRARKTFAGLEACHTHLLRAGDGPSTLREIALRPFTRSPQL